MKFFKSIKSLSIFLLLIFLGNSTLFGQDNAEEKIPVNQLDAKGKKHGTWYFSKTAAMGEPGYIEFGNYEHGKRAGLWYKMDKELGDLISIESFRNGMLHGEVKYFEMGKLYCIGTYLALNPQQKYDTIVVTDPVTLLESYRVLPTESGSIRHGMWRYYDPQTGYMIKEEEYVADELAYKKDFEIAAKVDSVSVERYKMQLPHNKKTKYVPRSGKRSATR